MNTKKYLITILLGVIWISADAQMVMRQLSVNEGLSQYYVSDIEQDKYGFIWMERDASARLLRES